MSSSAYTPPPPTSPWAIYRAIVGIGALCALLIVTVYQGTAARIRENQDRYLAGAVAAVLPAAASTRPLALTAEGELIEAEAATALPVFLGYDDDGRLVGAAITAEGMGYQDNIRLLYAYSFDEQAVTGLRILDSKETPGLGDRVETEAHFLASFVRLDARLTADGDALRNAIVTVKQGEKVNAWEIDGITGATITSVAVGDIVNASLAVWAPVLERERQRFATPGGTD